MSRGWALAAMAAVALAGCSGAGTPAAVTVTETVTANAQAAADQPVRVAYEVTAEGGFEASERLTVAWVDVTESTPSGISQSEQRAPYASAHDFAPGSPVGITIQAGTDVTSVSCTIRAGGEVIAQETSTGSHAVVMCSGLAP